MRASAPADKNKSACAIGAPGSPPHDEQLFVADADRSKTSRRGGGGHDAVFLRDDESSGRFIAPIALDTLTPRTTRSRARHPLGDLAVHARRRILDRFDHRRRAARSPSTRRDVDAEEPRREARADHRQRAARDTRASRPSAACPRGAARRTRRESAGAISTHVTRPPIDDDRAHLRVGHCTRRARTRARRRGCTR